MTARDRRRIKKIIKNSKGVPKMPKIPKKRNYAVQNTDGIPGIDAYRYRF